MINLRRHLWVLVVAIAVAVPAVARGKVPCGDRCVEDKDLCVKLCAEHAGPSALAYCKKACKEGETRCEQKCAKKGK